MSGVIDCRIYSAGAGSSGGAVGAPGGRMAVPSLDSGSDGNGQENGQHTAKQDLAMLFKNLLEIRNKLTVNYKNTEEVFANYDDI